MVDIDTGPKHEKDNTRAVPLPTLGDVYKGRVFFVYIRPSAAGLLAYSEQHRRNRGFVSIAGASRHSSACTPKGICYDAGDAYENDRNARRRFDQRGGRGHRYHRTIDADPLRTGSVDSTRGDAPAYTARWNDAGSRGYSTTEIIRR